MKTKEITICGKQVTLAYCYATEIIYRDIAGEDIIDYVKHVADCISNNEDPDPKRTLCAILSSSMAYDQSQAKDDGKEVPEQLTFMHLAKEAMPTDVILATVAVLDLRRQFYHVAKADEEEIKADEKEGEEKNE